MNLLIKPKVTINLLIKLKVTMNLLIAPKTTVNLLKLLFAEKASFCYTKSTEIFV